jgi:hypothetical protein
MKFATIIEDIFSERYRFPITKLIIKYARKVLRILLVFVESIRVHVRHFAFRRFDFERVSGSESIGQVSERVLTKELLLVRRQMLQIR